MTFSKGEGKYDNRWDNLREVTPSQNSLNMSIAKNNTSGFIGVSWDKTHNKYVAYVNHRGVKKIKKLGYFKTSYEAAIEREETLHKYSDKYKGNFNFNKKERK